MKIDLFGDFKLKDIVLIASLPDMGRVGGLVSAHIAKKTLAKDAARVILSDKPWVNQVDGLVEVPSDEYKILVDEKNSLVIFTGENQPQEPNAVFELVDFVIDTVQKFGNIRLIISSGGYLPMQKTDGDQVYGVATDQKLLESLKPHGVKTLSNDVKSITWFNGLVLGAAKNKNIDGIGLFGEIFDPEAPQHRTAKNIINKIEKILKIQIDTDELQIAEKPSEPKKDGPGIG
ncbi:MAG TPA: PAC2 family protein [Candidatus Nitrosotenuis sp.]|nr:PAC2 family protein [Candidatus Nitrosotenuis sp.]